MSGEQLEDDFARSLAVVPTNTICDQMDNPTICSQVTRMLMAVVRFADSC